MGQVSQADATAGFFLSLFTESFAVRALLGSLVAAALAQAAVRWHLVRSVAARRLVVLAPVITAAVAAVVSIAGAEAYLPQVLMTSAGARSGQVLELLGELRVVSSGSAVDVVVLVWALVASVLLCRRAVGRLAARRLLARAHPVPEGHPFATAVAVLAAGMGVSRLRVLFLAGCPGGALATGLRPPVVVVDPDLVEQLDAREVEGLVAHELAHVARRDPLLVTAVGVFGDLAFFLPTIHLAARWLRREQEEGADELASAHTRRPGALASSILKVWDRSGSPRQPAGACAAVPARRLLTAAGPALPRLRAPSHAEVVAARVQRLIEPLPALSTARRTVEVLLAAALLLTGVAAALLMPTWIATDLNADAMAFGVVPPPAAPVESPAFATFRALTPTRLVPARGDEREQQLLRSLVSGDAVADAEPSGCPCIETQAQLAAGHAAVAPSRPGQMAWRHAGHPEWEVEGREEANEARPLWTLPDTGPQVGFFVFGRNTPS